MSTLSTQEVAGFHLRLAKPELLEEPAKPADQSSIDDIAYGVVRSIVNNASLSVRGLKDPDEPEQADQVVGLYAIEELLFCLHMVDRLAFLDSTLDKRCAFMDAIVASVADILWRRFASTIDVSRFSEYFVSVYNDRQKEYASYDDVPRPRGESLKSTLFWEYGKRMAALISPRKNALRVTLIGDLTIAHTARLIPLVRQLVSGCRLER